MKTKLILRSGAELIAEERSRQINAEGWTASHDDRHLGGQLVYAALGYAEAAASVSSHHLSFRTSEFKPHPKWPWEPESWKPSDDAIRNLTKAGALIAAEIDRLQRLQK